MTEAEWADENPAPSKKLVPTWLWFCGGGCLVATILVVIGVMFVGGKVKEMIDPDVQYRRLAENIEFDERPESWTLMMGWGMGIDMWVFNDTRGYTVIFMHLDGEKGRQARKDMLDPKSQEGIGGFGGRQDVEVSTISVQGRELQMATFYQQGGSGAQADQQGQAAMLDVTPEGRDDLLMLMLIRTSGGERIAEQDVASVLEEFHVGPDR